MEIKESKSLGAKITNAKLYGKRTHSVDAKRPGMRTAKRTPRRATLSERLSNTLTHKHSTPESESHTPSQVSTTSTPTHPDRAARDPQRIDTEPDHGTQNGSSPKAEPQRALAPPQSAGDDLAQKVRLLSGAGQSVGDIVKTLQQYSVTAEQVTAWLAEGA